MKKTDNESILESVRNTKSVISNSPSKIDIDAFINWLSSHYSQINCFATSWGSLKINFRKLYFKYENVLPIIQEVILPVIVSYLFFPQSERKSLSIYFIKK